MTLDFNDKLQLLLSLLRRSCSVEAGIRMELAQLQSKRYVSKSTQTGWNSNKDLKLKSTQLKARIQRLLKQQVDIHK